MTDSNLATAGTTESCANLSADDIIIATEARIPPYPVFPTRVSVTTFNVWGANSWPDRADALSATFLALKSDVYLLQEITPDIIKHLDENIGDKYKRVEIEDEKTPGWLTESNVYWNDSLFELVDHGHGDLGIIDYPNRGLFWVRLRLRCRPDQTIFFATVHFPWVGCPTELETGMNQRIPATAHLCEHLRRLVPVEECTILGGDFNDDFHPIRMLSEEMGMMEVFECLDLPPPITHPVRPSSLIEEMRPSRTLDWMLCNMTQPSRVVAAFVKAIRGGAYPPVSDHLPVMAIFEIF